ncbi:MAG: GNAT family N-acetyltransferase [Clostridia bacterium]|nr:GNAT family N-acetyltransferase [Clostridia bacterium]
MKTSEMKQIVNMLYNEWNLGKKEAKAKGKICAWIYLFEVLEETEKVVLEKENNKVIGMCGYANWNSKKYIIRKKFFKLLKIICINSPLIKDKKAMIKYSKDYDYTPIELENHFDGEISLLIVDKKYRGKGIGKKMINRIFEYAKKDKMKNIEILTDESCNFKFYENCGCKKVYEKIIPNGEPDILGNITSEKGYIYEKIFN